MISLVVVIYGTVTYYRYENWEDRSIFVEINFPAVLTHNITIKVVWNDDKPIAYVNVTVQNNEDVTFFNGVTNATGVAVVQLTEGAYTTIVSKGNATKTESLNVDDKTTITVVLEAAYRISKLMVEVYSQDQFAYGSVVELSSKGYVVYNLTAVDGTATFNLPDGTYAVVARYQGRQQEAAVALNQDTQMPIVFQVIDEFNSLIVIVAVIVLLIILIATRRSRAR